MFIDGLVNRFFMKEYEDYDPKPEHVDSYRIDEDNFLIIEHHNESGKRFTSRFSVWEVMNTILG